MNLYSFIPNFIIEYFAPFKESQVDFKLRVVAASHGMAYIEFSANGGKSWETIIENKSNWATGFDLVPYKFHVSNAQWIKAKFHSYDACIKHQQYNRSCCEVGNNAIRNRQESEARKNAMYLEEANK